MQIICTGDWQCAVSNLDRCKVVVEHIIDVFQSFPKERRLLLHLGDVKESMNPVDQRVTNFIIDAFTEIGTHCERMLFVRGNHDNIQTQDGSPSIIPLLEQLGVACADDDWRRIELRVGADVYLVPYFRDSSRQKKAFSDAREDAAKRKSVKILAFHNEIAGCALSAYAKSEGISQADVGVTNYDLCVGGHIHLPQFIQPNVHYVGSPFCMDWGETNYEHRLLVLKV